MKAKRILLWLSVLTLTVMLFISLSMAEPKGEIIEIKTKDEAEEYFVKCKELLNSDAGLRRLKHQFGLRKWSKSNTNDTDTIIREIDVQLANMISNATNMNISVINSIKDKTNVTSWDFLPKEGKEELFKKLRSDIGPTSAITILKKTFNLNAKEIITIANISSLSEKQLKIMFASLREVYTIEEIDKAMNENHFDNVDFTDNIQTEPFKWSSDNSYFWGAPVMSFSFD